MPTQAREKATAIVLHAVRLAVLGGAAILAYLLLSLLDGPAHADPAVPTPPVGHDARSHDARSHPEIMPLGAVLESTSSVADQASDVLDDAAVADATRAVPTTAPARIPTTARITTPAPVTGTAPVPLAAKAIPAVPAAARVLGTVPGVADTVPAVLGNVPRALHNVPRALDVAAPVAATSTTPGIAPLHPSISATVTATRAAVDSAVPLTGPTPGTATPTRPADSASADPVTGDTAAAADPAQHFAVITGGPRVPRMRPAVLAPPLTGSDRPTDRPGGPAQPPAPPPQPPGPAQTAPTYSGSGGNHGPPLGTATARWHPELFLAWDRPYAYALACGRSILPGHLPG